MTKLLTLSLITLFDTCETHECILLNKAWIMVLTIQVPPKSLYNSMNIARKEYTERGRKERVPGGHLSNWTNPFII